MRYKFKRIIFFIFIICILYLGIREINYSNYKIIENGTKEVIYVLAEEEEIKIHFLGKNYVLDEKIQEKIQTVLDHINN